MSAAQPPPAIDYARFRHCFPDLVDVPPETIIEAYEEITSFSPSLVLAPELLRRLIAARVRAGLLGRAPAPIACSRAIATRVRRFSDDLRRLLEAFAERGLISDEGALKIQQLLEEFEVDTLS